jgi:pimeloyl-ACP methyl ester carboxylesterase
MMSATTSDGRALAYTIAGRGEMLVCHPGGPGFCGGHLGDLGGLDRARAVLTLDPRGAGGSDPPSSPVRYALADYASDLEELREHLGVESFELLGHSHGSLVAMLYAAERPDRVRKLVLVGTGARFHDDQVQAMNAAMLERSGETWFADASAALAAEQEGRFSDDAELGRLVARELPFYFAHYGERERVFAFQALEHPVHGAALRYYNEHEFLTFDLRPALQRISAPTVVIAGEKDFILGPSSCQEVADGIATGQLVVLADTGHFPWVENPAAFAAAVSGFLDS